MLFRFVDTAKLWIIGHIYKIGAKKSSATKPKRQKREAFFLIWFDFVTFADEMWNRIRTDYSMEFIGLLFVIAILIGCLCDRAKWRKKSPRERSQFVKMEKRQPPYEHYLKNMGLLPRDKEYYKWERKEKKAALQRKIVKERQERLKRYEEARRSSPNR